MILLIDNYDSFVFNLARYFEELQQAVCVRRNDKITIAEIYQMCPSHIVISPGPCSPFEAGMSVTIVQEFAGKIPILGICLGHQVIGHAFGADVIKAKNPMHGKSSMINHQAQGIFHGISNPLKVGRYHSLIVEGDKLPTSFLVSSRSLEGEIMSFSHPLLQLVGLQFHPESILTDHGHTLLNNFLLGHY